MRWRINFIAALENTDYQAELHYCSRQLDEKRLRVIIHAGDGRVHAPMILRAALKGLLPVMRGVDEGANGYLAFCDSHGALAVGHIPLHDGRTKQPLRTVVGGLVLTRTDEEDQELIASAADLGL